MGEGIENPPAHRPSQANTDNSKDGDVEMICSIVIVL